jgi:hypothetical protein
MASEKEYGRRPPLTDPLVRHSPEGNYFVVLREGIDQHREKDLRRLIQLEGGRIGSSLGKHQQTHGFYAFMSPQTVVQVKNHDAVQYIDVEHPETIREHEEEMKARREEQKSVPEGMEYILE